MERKIRRRKLLTTLSTTASCKGQQGYHFRMQTKMSCAVFVLTVASCQLLPKIKTAENCFAAKTGSSILEFKLHQRSTSSFHSDRFHCLLRRHDAVCILSPAQHFQGAKSPLLAPHYPTQAIILLRCFRSDPGLVLNQLGCPSAFSPADTEWDVMVTLVLRLRPWPDPGMVFQLLL